MRMSFVLFVMIQEGFVSGPGIGSRDWNPATFEPSKNGGAGIGSSCRHRWSLASGAGFVWASNMVLIWRRVWKLCLCASGYSDPSMVK